MNIDGIEVYPVGVEIKYPFQTSTNSEYLTISEIVEKYSTLDRICSVYILEWKDGSKYIGVKYAQNEYPTCIMKTYSTSSYDVHEKLHEDGMPEIVGIVKTFQEPGDAILFESKLQTEHRAAQRSDYLNHHNGFKDFTIEPDRSWHFLIRTIRMISMSVRKEIHCSLKSIIDTKKTNFAGQFNLLFREIAYWGIIRGISSEKSLSEPTMIGILEREIQKINQCLKFSSISKELSGSDALWDVFLEEYYPKYDEMQELYIQNPERWNERYGINHPYKNQLGLVLDSPKLFQEMIYQIPDGIETAICFNAKDGTCPLLLQKRFPNAKIVCLEYFSYYVKHLERLGFEVVCLNQNIKNWEEVIRKVKYDLVITNPPYQDSEHDAKRWVLWHQFIKKGFSSTRERGFVAFVTPTSWMSPGDMFEFMKKHDIQRVNTRISHLFSNIGSTFGYWIAQNQPYNKNTRFNDEIDVDLSLFQGMPVDLTVNSLSINLKVLNSLKTKFEFRRSIEYHTSSKSEWESTNGKYEVFHTNAQRLRTEILSPNNSLRRVMISLSGYVKPIYSEKLGSSQAVVWCEVQDHNEGRSLIHIINSKLIRYLLFSNKWSGWNSKKVFESIPELDLSHIWTDQELYDHFNLSCEEIGYIEKMVPEEHTQINEFSDFSETLSYTKSTKSVKHHLGHFFE